MGILGGFSFLQSSRTAWGRNPQPCKEPAEAFGARRERCQVGQKQLQVGTGRLELRRAGHPILQHVNKSLLKLPNPSCLSLQPPSFAGSKLLASGKLQAPTCPSPGSFFRAEQEAAPSPSCDIPAQST